MSTNKWQHEKTQVTVSVLLRYSSQKQRQTAMRDLKRSLGCEISSVGDGGCFHVETGRVLERKPAPKGKP